MPTFTALPSVGAEASLHIHTQVSEDQIALFGFLDREEKRLFERLITVSGVGPKLAIKMLSGLSPERTVQAIRAQDHAQLTRIPGVGKKLAERLVVELKDKLDDFAVAPAPRQACRGRRWTMCSRRSSISAISARRRRRRSSRRSRRTRRWRRISMGCSAARSKLFARPAILDPVCEGVSHLVDFLRKWPVCTARARIAQPEMH